MQVGIGGVAAVAGAVLGVQFSTDAGTTFNGADNGTAATNSTVTAPVDITINTQTLTAWATLHTNARIADSLFRVVGVGGDGAVDPVIPHVTVQFR